VREWELILEQLRRTAKRKVFEKWFVPIKQIRSTRDYIHLLVPDEKFRQEIIDMYWCEIDYAKDWIGIDKRLIYSSPPPVLVNVDNIFRLLSFAQLHEKLQLRSDNTYACVLWHRRRVKTAYGAAEDFLNQRSCDCDVDEFTVFPELL
jgi:hypothetical protein